MQKHKDLRLAFLYPERKDSFIDKWTYISYVKKYGKVRDSFIVRNYSDIIKLHKENVPYLEDYLMSSYHFMNYMVEFYQSSFEVQNYRRQSENVRILIDENTFSIAASTDENGYIEISLGLNLAIEDAVHTMLSSPDCLFALNKNDSSEYGINVHHLPEPVKDFFDSDRYIDYSTIIHTIYKGNLTKHPDFIPFFFKYLTPARTRQTIGDLLSSISLYWVICHEDAHNYLGHLIYFNTPLKMSETAKINYSELVAKFSNSEKDKRIARIRQACEIEADTNACLRLVDHILDVDFINMFPCLKMHMDLAYQINDRFSNFTPKEINFTTLIRLIVLSASIPIIVFEKNVKKYNADTTFYPEILDRLLNVMDAVLSRAKSVSTFKQNYEVVFPYELNKYKDMVTLVFIDLINAMETILWNERVMSDKDVHQNEDVRRIKSIMEDNNFSFEYIFAHLTYLQKDTTILKSCESYQNLFKQRHRKRYEDIKIWINEFSAYRIKANPRRKDKIIDSIRELFNYIDSDEIKVKI